MDGEALRVFYVPNARFDVPEDLWKLHENERANTLECSRDQGHTWHHVQRPDGPDFTHPKFLGFRSQKDGRYYFRLQSSLNGKPKVHEPVAIVVDTKRPMACLSVVLDDSGRCKVHFVVTDENLNIASLCVEYRVSEAEPWLRTSVDSIQPVSVVAWRGECAFDFASHVVPISVRLTVKDHAGNAVEASGFPNLKADALTQRSSILTAYSRQMASTIPVAGRVSQHPEFLPTTTDYANEAGNQIPTSNRTQPVADQDSMESIVANGFHTNSKYFELDFELESDATRAGAIQLWATLDRGQSWTAWGTTDSVTSPLRIEVENDGLFGFRLNPIVSDQPELTPPSQGSMPDIWVVVNTQNPKPR